MTVVDQERRCNPRAVCSGTQNAWKSGCRCPETIAAHERWKEGKRIQRAEAADWPAGECLAATHGSRYAAEVNGCRCPPARNAVRQSQQRREDRERQQRNREYSREFKRDTSRVRRATGGRLLNDPRREWRYGKAGVSSVAVMMLLDGLPDLVTRGERMAAMIQLERLRVRDRTTCRMRPMNDAELARRLHCSQAVMKELREERVRRREQRHLRRLADVQWRAAHKAHGREAHGPEHQRRERVRHAAAHAARLERRLAYMQGRRRRAIRH